MSRNYDDSLILTIFDIIWTVIKLGFYLAVYLAPVILIIWVVIHFILKFW